MAIMNSRGGKAWLIRIAVWRFQAAWLLAMLSGISFPSASGCDVCIRAPQIPFSVDCLDFLEIAMATREAVDAGEIEADPTLDASLSPDRRGRLRLSDVSLQQLVRRWLQTQPGRGLARSPMTLDLLFAETGTVIRIDFRSGCAVEVADQDWPADARLVTTKIGFYRLFIRGVVDCEQRNVVRIECEERGVANVLRLVFAPRRSEVSTLMN